MNEADISAVQAIAAETAQSAREWYHLFLKACKEPLDFNWNGDIEYGPSGPEWLSRDMCVLQQEESARLFEKIRASYQ